MVGTKNSTLALEYQRALGRKIGDRTWRKVKGYLRIGEDLKDIHLVTACAELRRMNPYKAIRRSDAARYAFISQNLPQLRCTGYELYEALMRLKPTPGRSTVYRWGQQIGCPLRLDKNYSKEEVQKWVLKIVSQTRFKFDGKTFTTDSSQGN